ncbi:Predicted DNA-binding protein, contains Ribbon-helix-helix (RHH) domain [Paracoccus aminovorans]|uniref:Predicted DNA-binding protein, contains Ribbon-helix-helix (RHH) domain n=1 Tax=Paracoccus aminovorans TaxID=34004 RepID=A0A1I2YWQ3_9RHOB|nr:ribbon-helix-helix domain-containing protein [Paracoccus aminovorans]CQR85806.1 hypothetical protein JCM7685_1232 [Paracoccus aminovorans]SFH29855.1 Predicted DNA-binding protein, contains Ribbon-helix-helix (RHH) domain [Paracoccus aminovorans]
MTTNDSIAEALRLPAMAPPAKRSVTIGGHRTSVSLEDAFWRELRGIAQDRGRTVAALIAGIDAARPPAVGLATALRLYVLAEIRQKLAAQGLAD